MSMKVLIVLLLFGVQLLTGQTVSKLEFENGTEVYQIIELQNNTVEFVNPLKKQPTLREIIFYKVVEKPYIEKNDELEVVTKEKEKPRKPDFDETIRPFTNGHGLQFLNWGSQDENTEYTYINAPEKEKNVTKNSNSTSNDSNENHVNDDKINDYKDNNNNDDDKNNDKKSHIDKDEDDDGDDDDDKINVKKPNINKDDDDDDEEDDKNTNKKHSNDDSKIEDDDSSKDDNDDKGANKKHSNDDSKIEDDDSSKDDDDISGAEKAVENTKKDDKKIVEDTIKDEEINKEEEEETREAKVYEEEINLAKKLRSELLNSTKEKYHTIERNNENATHERKKREVSYQNVPEAPKLPDLDVQSFPTYIQRMLANRPTFRNTQDSVKVRSNYNADLFHKMDGILSNNMPKTYGFKYSNDRSESWNDIYKTQDNQKNVIAPTFKNLSGSQTNNPYEKISEPDIELRNHFIADEEQIANRKETLIKNKNEIVHHTKNIYSTTSVINNNVDKNQRSVKINNEKPNIDTDDLDKSSGIDMKDKLITMLQNIDNKFTNGTPPKTYGMSIKGAEVQTWNDISVTPTVTKYENANKENIVENRPNKAENLNNAMNRLNLDFREDADSYDNAHKENLVLTKPHGVDKTNYAEEDNINTSHDNIDKRLGKYGVKPVTNIDNTLSENTSEISENKKQENKSNTVNKGNTNILQNYINPLNYNEANSDNDDEGIILNENKTENIPNKPKENVADDSMGPDEDISNYDQEFDQISESTNKVANNMLQTPTEKPFDADTYDEIDDPKDNYNEFKNSQYVLSTTERLTEEPEVTKENLLIVNEDLKFKMEESFDNIIKQFPKLKQIELTGTKAVVNFNNFNDGNNKKPIKPNTYGMHLEGDHGYIWNELTNPGKVIYVGNLNKINETKPNISHESTRKVKNVENKVENHTEPPKPKTNQNNKITTKQSIATTTENQNTVEEENKKGTEKPIENELNDKKNCNCNTDNVNEDNNVDSSNKNETETLKISLDELLKKDEFWKWLSNWTSTYMEVLNERVETLVQNEIANQLKQINEDKNNTKVNDCNNVDEGNKTNNTIDDNVDKQSDGNKDNTTESSKINESNKNATSGNKEEKSNTTALEPSKSNNVTDTTTEKNNSEGISKENELVKENNNTDQGMNKGKNNSLPVNIKSDTIYGNAIGNDHVTNIFIFYPRVDSNKTLEKIEPITNQTHSEISALNEKPVNITIDERFGVSEESKDNNTDDTVSKTKDLVNGQNTSSTVSSQQNKEDTTEKSKNSSKDTTTENFATTPKTEEELKNKTNDTELNGTSDNADSNTKQIDKTETTTGMSIKNDDETTPISTDNVTVSKTENDDSTTENLTTTNSVSDKSDSATEKTDKSDSTTEKPESASENSDSTIEKSDTAAEKSDSTTEKSDSKDTSDVTSTQKSADS